MKSTRAQTSYGRTTKTSESIPGEPGSHYRWAVTFDYDEGYLGINQDGDHETTNRVLLSPGQVAALKAFTRRRPTAKRNTRRPAKKKARTAR